MTLTKEHEDYENNCRQMFVGRTILKVIYGEIPYSSLNNDDDAIHPQSFYKTTYSGIDTLDYSVCFETDKTSIWITWDNTFVCYGLISTEVNFNNCEQKWDVTKEEKWANVVGWQIIDFKILWKEDWTSNLDGSNKVFKTYPQTFKITMENTQTVIITAAEFKKGENDVFFLMDNLLVTNDLNLAKRFKIVD